MATAVPDSDYRIKLQIFEGPLDLLLFLIRKNELDIYDIPIESVTKQYVEALRTMQQLDLDVAGEFFVMAASLMEIKSRMLLPKGQHAIDPNAEDEEVDPRWELVHQLLQYKKFKEAAATLAGLAETRQNLMARHVSALSAHDTDRPLKNVDRIELWNTFNIVLRRLAEKLVVGIFAAGSICSRFPVQCKALKPQLTRICAKPFLLRNEGGVGFDGQLGNHSLRIGLKLKCLVDVRPRCTRNFSAIQFQHNHRLFVRFLQINRAPLQVQHHLLCFVRQPDRCLFSHPTPALQTSDFGLKPALRQRQCR